MIQTSRYCAQSFIYTTGYSLLHCFKLNFYPKLSPSVHEENERIKLTFYTLHLTSFRRVLHMFTVNIYISYGVTN